MPSLPASPNLEHLKRQARDLLRAARAQDPAALARLAAYLPSLAATVAAQPNARPLRLAHALFVLAREYGFPSWPKLKAFVSASDAGTGIAASAPHPLKGIPSREGHAQELASLATRLADLAARRDAAGLATTLATLPKRDMLAVRALLVANGSHAMLVDGLLDGLEHASPRVRFDCAHALDRFADERCVAPLLPLLDDPVPRVRRVVLHVLSCDACKLAPLPVDAALAERVTRHALADPSIAVRRHATVALGSFCDDSTAKVLTILATEDADAAIRREARWALRRRRADTPRDRD